MTNLLQQIIVGVILLAVIIFVLNKIYVFFYKDKKNTNLHNCENCAGCDLKKFLQEKQRKHCEDFIEKNKEQK